MSKVIGTKYLNEKTGLVVIGATGREASQVIKESESLYPGIVKAGVTPGKGGSDELPCPIFNTLGEAKATLGDAINTALVYVPGNSVADAVMECIGHGIAVIYIVTEHVPIRDTVKFYAYAKQKGVTIVGPTSLGCCVPGIGRIGAIGGKDPTAAFRQGSLALISKSGGLTTTTAEMFMRRGWGIHTALAVGGDVISCQTYADILPEFEANPQIKGVVILGEPGGSYEEQAAELVKAGKFTKPLVAYIAGRFQEDMPDSVSFGHAGAIVERGMGKASDKIKALQGAGKNVRVADYYHNLIKGMEELGVPRDFEDSSSDTVKPRYTTLK